MEVIGHGGNGRGATENTLASCQAAIQAGADRLELDVQLVNGELVLAHPPRSPQDTLRNILNHLDVPLVLHLKRRHFNPLHDRRSLDRLAPLVTGREVTVSSFWPGTVTYAKRSHPHLRTAYATFWPGYDLLLAHRLGVAEFHGWHRTITARTVAKAAASHVKLVAFTPPATPPVIARLQKRGVRSVITDQVAGWKALALPPEQP